MGRRLVISGSQIQATQSISCLNLCEERISIFVILEGSYKRIDIESSSSNDRTSDERVGYGGGKEGATVLSQDPEVWYTN